MRYSLNAKYYSPFGATEDLFLVDGAGLTGSGLPRLFAISSRDSCSSASARSCAVSRLGGFEFAPAVFASGADLPVELLGPGDAWVAPRLSSGGETFSLAVCEAR